MQRIARFMGVIVIAVGTLTGVVTVDARPAWALTFTWNPSPLESGGLLLIDPTESNLPSFTGTGDPGDTVVVSATDAPSGRDYELCSASVNGNGTWSCLASAVPDFTGALTARVIIGDQAGSATEPFAHSALNPPRFTNATALGKDYLTREPLGIAMSGETYDDQSGNVTSPIVRIVVPSTGGLCEAPVTGGTFSCTLTLVEATDGSYPYTATLTTDFGTSLARTGVIVVDTMVDFVTITQPTNGQVITDLTPTISGTGEPAATVHPMIYPSFEPACTPPVVSAFGTWTCTMSPVDPGTYSLWSYQVDAAGNVGPSTEASLTFSVAAPPAPPVDPAPPPRPAAEEPPPAPSPTPSLTATPAPVVDPVATAVPETAPSEPSASSQALGTVGGGGAVDPTVFGSSLRTPIDLVQTPPAVLAGAAAGAASFVLFVALPAELLHAAVRENYDRLMPWRGRLRRSADRLVGRAQRTLGSTGSVALAAVLVAAITALVDPNAGADAATLRLWIAITMALLVVNVLVVGSLRLAARRWFAVQLAPRILPGAIVLTIVTVLASRVLGISPGIVFGLVLGLAIARELSVVESGRLAALSTTLLLALGLGAWLVLTVMLDVGSGRPEFGELLARETLVAITVESLSSLAIAMLPIAFMDGRAIWLWSRRIWVSLFSIALLTFVLVIVPMPSSWAETAGPLSTTVVTFAVFGVLSTVTWLVLTRRRERGDGGTAMPAVGAEPPHSENESSRP
jgi:hypothetical protein